MHSTRILEQNVKNSFHFVKDDLSMLEQEHKALLRRVAQLERAVERLQAKEISRFIGNKQTKELHQEDCLLAQGSSVEQTIQFRTTKEGKKQGYTECLCME